MLIEEEESKVSEINPDAIVAGFEDEGTVEEVDILMFSRDDEREDEIDLPYDPNPEGYW